jgi:hypothetical protein
MHCLYTANVEGCTHVHSPVKHRQHVCTTVPCFEGLDVKHSHTVCHPLLSNLQRMREVLQQDLLNHRRQEYTSPAVSSSCSCCSTTCANLAARSHLQCLTGVKPLLPPPFKLQFNQAGQHSRRICIQSHPSHVMHLAYIVAAMSAVCRAWQACMTGQVGNGALR